MIFSLVKYDYHFWMEGILSHFAHAPVQPLYSAEAGSFKTQELFSIFSMEKVRHLQHNMKLCIWF
jgi:hypothetical protein